MFHLPALFRGHIPNRITVLCLAGNRCARFCPPDTLGNRSIPVHCRPRFTAAFRRCAFRLRKTLAGFVVATLISFLAAFFCTAVMTRTGYFNEPDSKLALLWLDLALGIANGTITAAIALPGAADEDEDEN